MDPFVYLMMAAGIGGVFCIAILADADSTQKKGRPVFVTGLIATMTFMLAFWLAKAVTFAELIASVLLLTFVVVFSTGTVTIVKALGNLIMPKK